MGVFSSYAGQLLVVALANHDYAKSQIMISSGRSGEVLPIVYTFGTRLEESESRTNFA